MSIKTIHVPILVTRPVSLEKAGKPRPHRNPLGGRFRSGVLFCSALLFAVVLLGQRLTASFITTPGYAAGAIGTSLAVEDFDGDGILDLAVGYAGGVVILLNATDW